LAGVLIVLVFHTPPASAQSAAQAPAIDPPPAVTWRVAAGYDAVSLRDIARTTRPVDASPVAWRGTGAIVLVHYTRAGSARFHRVEFSAARAGHFTYDSGLESIARPSDDRYRRIEGRYEYRRYFFRDVSMRGLDLGAGLQGIAAQSRIARHVPENIEAKETRTALAPAVAAAVRLQRWTRVGLEAGWINGLHFSRLTSYHSVDPAAGGSRWGGGWLTDVSIGADIALTRVASLAIVYFQTNDGLMSSHRGVTSATHSFSVGVTYAR
jgi:hypothetical protein